MSFSNPQPEQIRAFLGRIKSIAVVGYSPNPGRASHAIAACMQSYGYRIVPVRPGIREGLGERAYPDLDAIPEVVDLANVFRAGRFLPQIVDQCLRRGIGAIWMQEGAEHEASAERAQAAGMTVVMGRCIMRDYKRLCLA